MIHDPSDEDYVEEIPDRVTPHDPTRFLRDKPSAVDEIVDDHSGYTNPHDAVRAAIKRAAEELDLMDELVVMNHREAWVVARCKSLVLALLED